MFVVFSMYFIVCSGQYVVCCLQCAAYTVLFVVCSVQCVVCSVQCVGFSGNCAVCNFQFAICCSILYSMFSVWIRYCGFSGFSVYSAWQSVQSKVYGVQYALYNTVLLVQLVVQSVEGIVLMYVVCTVHCILYTVQYLFSCKYTWLSVLSRQVCPWFSHDGW